MIGILASFCGIFGFSAMFNSPVRLAATASDGHIKRTTFYSFRSSAILLITGAIQKQSFLYTLFHYTLISDPDHFSHNPSPFLISMFTGKHQNKADQKQNIRYPDCRDPQPHGQISSATGSNGKKENYPEIIKSLLQLFRTFFTTIHGQRRRAAS